MFTSASVRARRAPRRRRRVDGGEDLGQVLAGVAGARAAAAAGAEHVAELERVDGELVVDALAEARVLVVARVVARGVQREDAGLAGVPVAAPRAAAHALRLVDDVEAVAGGADRRRRRRSRCSATPSVGQQRVLEVRRRASRARGRRRSRGWRRRGSRAAARNVSACARRAPSAGGAGWKRACVRGTKASPLSVTISTR